MAIFKKFTLIQPLFIRGKREAYDHYCNTLRICRKNLLCGERNNYFYGANATCPCINEIGDDGETSEFRACWHDSA